MLAEGQQVELVIDKPAAGGWMLARHHGQVVLVRGAIPGERVTAWVERAEKRLAYAGVRDVLEPSPDRREPGFDPLCGGAVFAHIAYERQRQIKAEILQDAFTRLGRHPLDILPEIAASPEQGYRMRARFHVRGRRAGFYREGTHQLCDPAPTGQMQPAAIEAVQALAAVLEEASAGAAVSIALTENIAASERAAHVELAPGARIDDPVLERAVASARLAGISARGADGALLTAGDPAVHDPLDAVTGGRARQAGTLRRQAESFFQGNRYLLPGLVTAVLDAVPDTGHVVDLYAGAGLFAVSLAAAGHLEITAVESDRASGADLRENARALAPRIMAEVSRVETFLSVERRGRIDTLIVDPPRTGLSKDAAESIVRVHPSRVVYVSCDPATLARDARRLLDAGYALQAIRGFDLFPNTPHVEALAVFEHAGGQSR
jgi:23S rRNA (uracil1939-C5)-methyltransferase